ncbi:MAG: hypothetical protein R3B84_17380 [Zavarzinella sp.]
MRWARSRFLALLAALLTETPDLPRPGPIVRVRPAGGLTAVLARF